MYHYKIDFAKYKLRNYEKILAIKEFENQFPFINEKKITDKEISFSTNDLVDELKFKKLTFYSEIHYQSAQSKKLNSILTDQAIIESYRIYSPDQFGEIKPGKSREIRYLTHSLHEYKGRFYPQLVKSFMNYAGIKEGDIVLDPFCGSGTTLVESLLYGVNAVGIDINPVAYLVAQAKVKSLMLKKDELVKIKGAFDDLKENIEWNNLQIDDYKTSLDIEYLLKWFPENNLRKIFFLQEKIQTLTNKTSQLFAKVVLSNLLRDFSYQDPTQLRIRRRADKPQENLIYIFKKKYLSKLRTSKSFMH